MSYRCLFLLILGSILHRNSFASFKVLTYYAPTHNYFKYMGRIDFSMPGRPVFWQPGVNIRFAFEGDSCGIIVEDELRWGSNHNYIELVVDGVATRQKLINKFDTVWVNTLKKTSYHTVEMYKNTEANIGFLAFGGILCNKIKKIEEKFFLTIECIGNSITCGTGSDQSDVACGTGVWYDQHNAYMSYGLVLARQLNSQIYLSSVSGIGLTKSCCNIKTTMPQVYDKIDMSGNNLLWKFDRHKPDIITICLGQNDGIQDSAVFVTQYINFLKILRNKYPKAHFICLSSPMADENLKAFMVKSINAVVANTKAKGDKRVNAYFFTKQYNSGCDGHPSLTEHNQIAKELEGYFSDHFFPLK